MATGIDAADTLERRLRRIVSDVPVARTPVVLVACLLAIGLSTLTVGLGPAPEHERPANPTAAEPELASTALAFGGTMLLSTELRGTAGILAGARRATSSSAGGREVVGTARVDRLAGSAGRDILAGRGGDDELTAGGGRDVVRGGAGEDDIRSGRGDDVVETWRDGSPDVIDCGPGGRDRAVVDSSDATVGCEVVVRREPVRS
jgi:Ca2+-binding RTX toxin-like protein